MSDNVTSDHLPIMIELGVKNNTIKTRNIHNIKKSIADLKLTIPDSIKTFNDLNNVLTNTVTQKQLPVGSAGLKETSGTMENKP